MSVGNLGGASFQIKADAGLFQKAMQAAKTEAVRTSQVLGSTVINVTQTVNAKFGTMAKSADQATAALTKLGGATNRNSHLGLGMLAIGQMVDDMQYGFRSIVNNIPQVVYLMGGSAGLAGGAAVAAVAVNLLVNHWDNLIDMMQSRWLGVAASDLERVRIQAEKAGESFEALMKAPSEAGAREINKLKEAMTDFQKGGAAGVFKGLAGTVAGEPGMRAEETPAEQARRRQTEGVIRQLEDPKHRPMMGDPDINDLKKELHEMNEKLNRQNQETAKILMGKSLQAGEEGDNARTALKRLVEKNPGAFSPEFRARLQQISPDRIQSEIELENLKKARQRAAGTAGTMLGGPLGTQIMLAGAGAGGPLGADEIGKMMSGPTGRRLAARGLGDAAAQMAAAGMTGEQAKGVMGAMDIRKMYELGKKRSQELGIPLGNMGQVDPRVLDEVYRKAFAEAMKSNTGKPGATEGAIGKALKAAGVVGQDAKEVYAEMKAQLADRKKELMLGGMSAKQAEAQILKEQQQRAFPNSMMPAMHVGITQLAKMSQVNALNGAQDVAKRQLDELIAIRKGLAQRRAGNQAAMAVGPE